MSKVNWVKVPGFNGLYEVSPSGKVRNTQTNAVLKSERTGDAARVRMYKDGNRVTMKVSRLVSLAKRAVPVSRTTTRSR